jgi:NADH dehydrogenase
MATIGRSRAIAKVGRLEMSGMLAWLAWLVVHVIFLVDFRNRFVVMFAWMWQYITFKRGARLITGHTSPSAEDVSAAASSAAAMSAAASRPGLPAGGAPAPSRPAAAGSVPTDVVPDGA